MKKEIRPWGEFEILYSDDNCVVKKITVYPGKQTSLQYHGYRTEDWVDIDGELTYLVGSNSYNVSNKRHIRVEKGQKHRIANFTKKSASLIEIWTGDKLSEDDIVRLQDDFGR